MGRFCLNAPEDVKSPNQSARSSPQKHWDRHQWQARIDSKTIIGSSSITWAHVAWIPGNGRSLSSSMSPRWSHERLLEPSQRLNDNKYGHFGLDEALHSCLRLTISG
ncbi:hypothetical protein FSARC_13884 [Fusarium sarcochroum]|uniref:Uncharacterized protein n=1 Tax=Fusarium sarcochroum TaxID=1208366 RepID=A0A8H4SYD9_9HYPO|nr:hypothetical protein FSARC_13884 [Fusarium sarcochroum]